MAKGWKLHLYLLVIGLGVETEVIEVAFVPSCHRAWCRNRSDSSCWCSTVNYLDMHVSCLLCKICFKLELKTYNDSSSDGCSCIGLVALLDGTTVTFFLALFLFGFGEAGGGASDS